LRRPRRHDCNTFNASLDCHHKEQGIQELWQFSLVYGTQSNGRNRFQRSVGGFLTQKVASRSRLLPYKSAFLELVKRTSNLPVKCIKLFDITRAASGIPKVEACEFSADKFGF
jgi:hypothetical protein